MKGQRVGYIRVSTVEQNTDRQLEGIELDRQCLDQVSAKDTNRPALQSMLDFVRQDDLVIVHSMDRLACSLDDLRRIVKVSRREQYKSNSSKRALRSAATILRCRIFCYQ